MEMRRVEEFPPRTINTEGKPQLDFSVNFTQPDLSHTTPSHTFWGSIIRFLVPTSSASISRIYGEAQPGARTA